MSCKSASGHWDRSVSFWQNDFVLSDLVVGSQLNKSSKTSNKSGLAIFFSLNYLSEKSGTNSAGIIANRNINLARGKNPRCDLHNNSVELCNPVFYYASPNHDTNSKDCKSKDEKSQNKDFPQRKIKILIAEDDEVSSQLLAIILKDIAYEIIYTETGEDTVNQCKNHSDIDLILMDLKMPELDGIQTTKKIREFNKNIIIIAQTARAMDGDREEALAAGCNDYITKPIDKYELLKKIKKVL